MADREDVRYDMFFRLDTDNKIKLFQAGAAWEDMPMGFYYLTEQQVDIATKRVMLSALERDGTTLLPEYWIELRERVDRASVVSDAIDTITELSLNGIIP